jgi:hypothetical protein
VDLRPVTPWWVFMKQVAQNMQYATDQPNVIEFECACSFDTACTLVSVVLINNQIVFID